MGDLDARVALVTGAARGIGRATVEALAQEGARIVLNDLDAGLAEEAAAALRDAGHEAVAAPGDVSDPAHCEAMVQTATDAFGDLHVIVNNAGLTRDRTIQRLEDADWNLVLDVVLRGAFNVLRAAAPLFRLEPPEDAPHRKVVNVSSVVALDGNAGQANYAAAKAGLLGLTRTMAREWARYRVNVNAVAPGFIDTRLTQARDEETGLGLPEDRRAMIESLLPWGVGEPHHVADVVAFLASPRSDYVTGEVLRVAGPALGSF